MPIISEFKGIKIILWPAEDTRHNPHFHAVFGEYQISYDITTNGIQGTMPAGKMMDVIIWARKYRKQIKKNWYRIKYGKPTIEIPGL